MNSINTGYLFGYAVKSITHCYIEPFTKPMNDASVMFSSDATVSSVSLDIDCVPLACSVNVMLLLVDHCLTKQINRQLNNRMVVC